MLDEQEKKSLNEVMSRSAESQGILSNDEREALLRHQQSNSNNNQLVVVPSETITENTNSMVTKS